MSWQPRIQNKNQEKIIREVRKDKTSLESLKTTENVVVVGKDRFVCSECGIGWTFARMKTIVCCGITYFKD